MGNGVPTWKSKSGPLDNDELDTLYPLDGLYRQGKRNKWLLDNITTAHCTKPPFSVQKFNFKIQLAFWALARKGQFLGQNQDFWHENSIISYSLEYHIFFGEKFKYVVKLDFDKIEFKNQNWPFRIVCLGIASSMKLIIYQIRALNDF